MKHIFLLLLIGTLCSCGNQKLVENSLKGQIIGVVHTSKTGCPLYIDVVDDSQTKKMYPVNLAEEYQIDGTRIQFDYANSKAMQPSDCIVDQVISITEITLLK